MRVEAEPGFVLHRRAFGETSSVLEVLTENYGRIGLIARGNRAPKKNSAKEALEPGVCMLMSFSGRGELPLLSRFESTQNSPRLIGERLLSLLYVNELMVTLLPRSDAHPRLFHAYAELLERLASAPLAPLLRQFERGLLEELGYGIDAQHDLEGAPILAEARYRLEPEAGFALASNAWRGTYSGASVLCLDAPEQARGACATELRKLTRALIEVRLAGRTLHSWQMLGEFEAIKHSS